MGIPSIPFRLVWMVILATDRVVEEYGHPWNSSLKEPPSEKATTAHPVVPKSGKGCGVLGLAIQGGAKTRLIKQLVSAALLLIPR